MVQRQDSNIGKMEEFEGVIESVTPEISGASGMTQYHFVIAPAGIEVKGKTGKFHEWIGLSKTATEDRIPQGSVLDQFLRQVEICLPAAKKAATVKAAFGLMVGKKFRFQRMKLGKEFEGHAAKEYIVPVALA